MNKDIQQKLAAYKRKFYINLLIKGGLITLGAVAFSFVFFNVLEYSFRFGGLVRAGLFFGFIILMVVLTVKWVIDPLIRILLKTRQLTNEEAAKQIGGHFPAISDKLLNIIQLDKNQDKHNALVNASIKQKSGEIAPVPFADAVDYKVNLKYLKYTLPAVALLVILAFAAPNLITESSHRIINYKTTFAPEAPFNFKLLNESLLAFKNEDFTVNLAVEGKAVPEAVYLVSEGRRIKLTKTADGYAHTFPKIQRDEDFRFEAAGFSSKDYAIDVVERPNIKNFTVHISYPAYLNRESDRLSNTGNLEIPEGSSVQWQFNTLSSDSVSLRFEKENKAYDLAKAGPQLFQFEKKIVESDNYLIDLKNRYSENKDIIRYHITAIPDQYPAITLDQMRDTTLYNYIILGGNISDDHGLTDLNLYYKTKEENAKDPEEYSRIPIKIDRGKTSQSYYYQWLLDSLDLTKGKEIEYFLEVKDNDGVNGYKPSRTGIYTFKAPTKKELKEELEKSSENSRKQIDENIEKAKELNENIDESINRLKGKKELNWQDEKLIRDLVERKKELEENIRELQERFKRDSEKRDRFSEEKNEAIKEKVEQLQKLMDELLDEETKKLYDELQKLLEENQDLDDVRNQLENIENMEENLEKDLERTLELFKQMKFDFKLEEMIRETKELAEEQENLAEETENKENDLEEISEKQEELNKQNQEIEESIQELQQMNQDLKNPRPMQDISQEQQEIKQEQENLKDAFEKNKRKKAGESQMKMSEQMQQMSQKLQQMQMNMEMSMMQENLDHLRDIEDNLIKLSFSQEELMDDFRRVNQSDPRFIDLSQRQLKLRDDAKIIEDSLRSLAERVFQIRSFVTREVDAMNDHMDESVKALQERKKNEAVGKQQFAMTSMNNLALLLDDVLQQMQQQMADAMGMPNKSNQKGQQNVPSLTELQKQLNQKIDQLKKSGKTGRQLSEELAKLAAEQERIRRALQQQQEKIDQMGGKGGSDGMQNAIEKMEETEMDLVNKQLTEKTIERQKEILTRLLEAEDALRERELDEKREGEQAKEHTREIPPAFQEYIKLKEQEIELLKTVPPKMNPFYKKEIDEYFKRLKQSNSN